MEGLGTQASRWMMRNAPVGPEMQVRDGDEVASWAAKMDGPCGHVTLQLIRAP